MAWCQLGNKPLSEPMMTKMYMASQGFKEFIIMYKLELPYPMMTKIFMASLGFNELIIT